MKYFVFSDVHGDYNALIDALGRAEYDKYNPNHQLISCGDNFGRASTGLGSKGVWEFLTSSEHINTPICIRGNHESILLNIFRKGKIGYIDCFNGEDKTIDSFANCNNSQSKFNNSVITEASKTGVEEWLYTLPWYYETTNFICTHGWLPNGIDWNNLKEATNSDWDAASWANIPLEIERLTYKYKNGLPKTLIFGHWHTDDLGGKLGHIYINEDMNFVALDCCTALTHRLEIAIIED